MSNDEQIIRVIAEETATGYSAYCSSIPVYTTGTNRKELQSNLKEAISFYYKELGETTGPIKTVIQWPV